MEKQHSKELGTCCFLLIVLAFLSIAYTPIFNVYDEFSIYIVTALLVFCLVRTSVSRFDIVTVVLTAIYLAVSVIITDGGMGSVLTYFCGTAFLIVISRAEFFSKQINILTFLSGAVVIALSLLSLFYINNYWTLYESSGFLNPNTYSVFLFYAYMLYVCISPTKNFSVVKLLMTVMAVIGVFNYRSRAMAVAILAFCLMQLLTRQRIFHRKIFAISVVLVVIGLLIPFVYLLLYRSGIDLIIMGKSLFTGREKLWSNMLEAFGSYPAKWLFGLGSKVSLSDHSLNIHNNLFVVIVNFGLLGFALFTTILFKYIKKACDNLHDLGSYRWYSMFIASILVLGMSETMSFWAPNMVFAYLGLGMAANNINKCLYDEV